LGAPWLEKKPVGEEQGTLIRSCGMTLSDLKEEMLEILWVCCLVGRGGEGLL